MGNWELFYLLTAVRTHMFFVACCSASLIAGASFKVFSGLNLAINKPFNEANTWKHCICFVLSPHYPISGPGEKFSQLPHSPHFAVHAALGWWVHTWWLKTCDPKQVCFVPGKVFWRLKWSVDFIDFRESPSVFAPALHRESKWILAWLLWNCESSNYGRMKSQTKPVEFMEAWKSQTRQMPNWPCSHCCHTGVSLKL